MQGTSLTLISPDFRKYICPFQQACTQHTVSVCDLATVLATGQQESKISPCDCP